MRVRAAAIALTLGVLSPYACGAATSFVRDSDAPQERWTLPTDPPSVSTYQEALGLWRDAHDINNWIGASFEYDPIRAVQLSETQRGMGARIRIHEPAAFFVEPKGVCVDLARFALETLRAVDPARVPVYLMIEFDPIELAGNTLRRHWVVAYRQEGSIFVFADSKRPGYLAGPYASVGEFIDDYAKYRDRRIVSFSERSSYERQARQRLTRMERAGPGSTSKFDENP